MPLPDFLLSSIQLLTAFVVILVVAVDPALTGNPLLFAIACRL